MGIFNRSQKGEVEIIEFKPKHRQAFKDLNYAWLEKYFEVEPYDEIVLSDPKTHILNNGGTILMASIDDEIVGTCALLRQTERKYELAKLAVDENYQGRHIGRALCEAAIRRARDLGAATLVLATSEVLVTANQLYHRLGFKQTDLDVIGPLPYKRPTIVMVKDLTDAIVRSNKKTDL
jgi:N-acetylglutamate synthase-like GNAT family acetyltransferase